MKTLKNKTTEIPETSQEGSKMTTFAVLCEKCINSTPQEGLDLKSMRDRLQILDVLGKSKKEIKLEDAHAETLKKAVKSMRWMIMHKDIVDFLESVEKL